MNYDSCLTAKASDQTGEVVACERHTARRRAVSRTGNVNEDGAAAPRYARSQIVVDFNDKIVEIVIATQPVAWFIGRPMKWPVIAAVGGVLAPSVVEADRTHGQECPRPSQTIGSPPQPNRMKAAGRGAAIALALAGLDPTAAQRNPQRPLGSGYQPPPGAAARAGAEVNDT